MSATFNRRFALEQAALVHSRNSNNIIDGTKDSVVRMADRFFNWLEEVK